MSQLARGFGAGAAVDDPIITIGTPREYALWFSRLRNFFAAVGANSENLEQVDARYNYRENRITLYHLSHPSDERSVAETLSHEYLHALLFQPGEQDAARRLDLVSKPVRSGDRVGGL
jgi:hypothetical protein